MNTPAKQTTVPQPESQIKEARDLLSKLEAPSYPITTVRLVPAQNSPVKLKSRYSPVPIKGEPASVTLLRDRGKLLVVLPGV